MLSSAPTACIQASARRSSAPTVPSSPASSPGVASCPWSGCRRTWRAGGDRNGSDPAGTTCPTPSAPGGHIVHYPLRAGRLMNFVGALERSDWRIESWSARGTPEELIADFRGWHPDIQAFIRAIEVPYKWALMVRAPLERWTVGRVTLLGDAAHSMLPFLAQGAVMAIEDGYVLARCLAQYDVETALQHYESARRERTRRTVEGSAANIYRFHNRALADPEEGRKFINQEWASQKIALGYDGLCRDDAASGVV